MTASATLRVGDFVELSQPADEFARPARSDLAILHADERCVVADKPSGMAFSESRHGGRSALDLLAGRYPSPRAIHRLDKETSGVVVVALGRQAEEQLGAELRAGEAHVEYVAVVRGTLQEDHGRIDVPLGKRRKSDVRLVPDPDHGDPCATAWTLQEELRGFAVLRLIPEHGGRSHQVRAHLAAAGLPALCDQLYGEDDRLLLSQLKLDYRPKRGRPERAIVTRPVLHAERYVSPALNVVAPLPGELEVLLAQLRRLRPPG